MHVSEQLTGLLIFRQGFQRQCQLPDARRVITFLAKCFCLTEAPFAFGFVLNPLRIGIIRFGLQRIKAGFSALDRLA